MAKVENKASIIDRLDFGIIGSIILLAITSMYAIYVAAMNDPSMGSPKRTVIIQALWYVMSTVMVIVIMQFDADQLFKIAPLAYGIGIVLLIAVLFLYNRAVFIETGAKSWFQLGPLTFQPSEVMKPALSLIHI